MICETNAIVSNTAEAEQKPKGRVKYSVVCQHVGRQQQPQLCLLSSPAAIRRRIRLVPHTALPFAVVSKCAALTLRVQQQRQQERHCCHPQRRLTPRQLSPSLRAWRPAAQMLLLLLHPLQLQAPP
jgi:hypothetical protein